VLPKNTTLKSIPSRLKLYEKCRYERASYIQEISRLVGKDLGSGPPLDTAKFTGYNFGHDEWDHSTQMLRKWEWENNKNLYWRMPTSFGPMPGPRQDFYGNPRSLNEATFKTTSIKFKSSRTVLQNLFPTEKFKFAAPDTVAYATFAVSQLDNLEWLGGRGYNHFGLYIHGVQYTRDDGTTEIGTYLPVLFESLTDPIISGRDELGAPKLFADLAVQQSDDTWTLNASWMSSNFCTMTLSSLHEPARDDTAAAPQGSAQPDEGMLVHKHIPATGGKRSKHGTTDVSYSAFCPNKDEPKTLEVKVLKTLKATTAEIKFDALDWKALPTLHHIVDRLREVPVFEVVEAKIVEGTGVSDVSAMVRLE
jgi:acetoacetate decarboxylase